MNLKNPEKASAKKREMFAGFDKEVDADSWRFLTGSIENIKLLLMLPDFILRGKEPSSDTQAL